MPLRLLRSEPALAEANSFLGALPAKAEDGIFTFGARFVALRSERRKYAATEAFIGAPSAAELRQRADALAAARGITE